MATLSAGLERDSWGVMLPTWLQSPRGGRHFAVEGMVYPSSSVNVV